MYEFAKDRYYMNPGLIRLLKAVVRRTWRTPTHFAHDVLANTRAVAADVGAAAGLQGQWQSLDGNAVLYLFEPFPDAAADLERLFSSRPQADLYRIIPVGLSSCDGIQTLHVTNSPTGSSLKSPVGHLGVQYTPPDYFYPIREIPIKVARLDTILNEAGETQLDFIKLDTQGAEADILEGLGESRRGRLTCVESEVNLVGAIPGGTTFGRLAEMLGASGLEFFDLRISRGYRRFPIAKSHPKQFRVHGNCKSISARAWEADVVWFRRPELVVADGSWDGVRKLVLAYCMYHFFTEAWHVLDLAEQCLALRQHEISGLRKTVLEWHRYVRSIFPLDWPWAARLLSRRQRWQQYTWLPYPNS